MKREAEEAKTEGKVWELVNKERKRRERIKGGIEMREWKEYFMALLGGVERKVVRGERERGEEIEESELEWEEVREVLRKLKDGKAMGKDELPNEIWRGGNGEMVMGGM